MKKIISYITLILVILTVATVLPRPVYARVSPEANRNKFERAVARGQVSQFVYTALNAGASVTDVYMATLKQNNQLTDYGAGGGQTWSQMGADAVKSVTQALANKYVQADNALHASDPNWVLLSQTAADKFAADLAAALLNGTGLTALQVGIYTGISNPLSCSGYGCFSASQGGVTYTGFYAVRPVGCTNSDCQLYFPIGTGPNQTAKEGQTVNAAGVVIPPGTVQARAVTMATIPETCDQIHEATPSTTFRDGTQFDLRLGVASQGVKTQSGSSYASWSLAPSTYTLVPLNPGTSSLRSCLTDATGSHFGVFTDNLVSSATDTFDVAYGPPPAWFQVQGGDVYAANSLSSVVPSGASPRLFLLDGTLGGYPGLATYGGASTDYDFSADGDSKGEAYVSGKNWLVNDSFGDRDFYGYFYSKLGSPTTPDYLNLTDPLPQPASDSGKPIYVQGNMTTSGNWTVTGGQKYVFLVDGALTIGGKINITGNGFIAFIVKNDITISPSVGVPYNSVTPVVEGVYVSGGAIHTGTSSVAGAERFVGRGMFVANHVALERDLQMVNQNAAYAAELFIYNPELLVNLPDTMKNVPVSWQEVAP